jgi:hypothetical protein
MSFLRGSTGSDEAATAADKSLLPEQSEDTDAGWGEYTEPDDDERLRLDRPPHWEDH